MSKKKFTNGLTDLVNSEFDTHDIGVTEKQPDTTQKSTQVRKPGGKRFVTNLDSLLSEISEDPFFSEPTAQKISHPGKSKSTDSEGYRAPVTGLDALIRQTLQLDVNEHEDDSKRRISVVVDKQKLDRLKTIARMEGAFMKDIISGLIEAYVRKYAQDKGVEI